MVDEAESIRIDEVVLNAFADAGSAGLTVEQVAAACPQFPATVVLRRLEVLRSYRAVTTVNDRPHEMFYQATFAPYVMLLLLRRLSQAGGQAELHRMLSVARLAVEDEATTVEVVREQVRSWYLWRRLVRATSAPGSLLRRTGTVVLVAGPLFAVAALVGGFTPMPVAVERVLAWPGYLWLALFLYLLLAVFAGEIVRPLLTRWLTRRAAEPVAVAAASPVGHGRDEPAPASPAGGDRVALEEPAPPPAADTATAAALLSRRRFVSRIVGGAAAAAAVGTVSYGTWDVLDGPGVKRIMVPLAKLPRAAHGFQIAERGVCLRDHGVESGRRVDDQQLLVWFGGEQHLVAGGEVAPASYRDG